MPGSGSPVTVRVRQGENPPGRRFRLNAGTNVLDGLNSFRREGQHVSEANWFAPSQMKPPCPWAFPTDPSQDMYSRERSPLELMSGYVLLIRIACGDTSPAENALFHLNTAYTQGSFKGSKIPNEVTDRRVG